MRVRLVLLLLQDANMYEAGVVVEDPVSQLPVEALSMDEGTTIVVRQLLCPLSCPGSIRYLDKAMAENNPPPPPPAPPSLLLSGPPVPASPVGPGCYPFFFCYGCPEAPVENKLHHISGRGDWSKGKSEEGRAGLYFSDTTSTVDCVGHGRCSCCCWSDQLRRDVICVASTTADD